MPRGSKPGEHRGGRAAGTPNKPKGEKALVVLDPAEAEGRVLIEAAYRARSFLASGRTWAARPANARGELIRSCTVRSWRRRIRLSGRFPYRPTPRLFLRATTYTTYMLRRPPAHPARHRLPPHRN